MSGVDRHSAACPDVTRIFPFLQQQENHTNPFRLSSGRLTTGICVSQLSHVTCLVPCSSSHSSASTIVTASAPSFLPTQLTFHLARGSHVEATGKQRGKEDKRKNVRACASPRQRAWSSGEERCTEHSWCIVSFFLQAQECYARGAREGGRSNAERDNNFGCGWKSEQRGYAQSVQRCNSVCAKAHCPTSVCYGKIVCRRRCLAAR